MNIEKLKPGMIVFDVGRRKMGNTAVSTVCVWRVRIESVDIEKGLVRASWNGNAVRSFGRSSWNKWRPNAPLLIKTAFGRYRLATREERAAAKQSDDAS